MLYGLPSAHLEEFAVGISKLLSIPDDSVWSMLKGWGKGTVKPTSGQLSSCCSIEAGHL